MNDQIITKTYQNIEVHFRAEDGWIDATKLAKAYGKQLDKFWQRPNWKPFQTDKAYTNANYSGTWLEPDLAVALAQWLDKGLGVWAYLNRPKQASLPSSDAGSYITLYEFQRLKGCDLEQPDKNRLSAKAKELTLERGLEVTNPRRVQLTEQGKANSTDNNAYPYCEWLNAYVLLGLESATVA